MQTVKITTKNNVNSLSYKIICVKFVLLELFSGYRVCLVFLLFFYCFSIVLLAESVSFVAVLLFVYVVTRLVYPFCTREILKVTNYNFHFSSRYGFIISIIFSALPICSFAISLEIISKSL